MYIHVLSSLRRLEVCSEIIKYAQLLNQNRLNIFNLVLITVEFDWLIVVQCQPLSCQVTEQYNVFHAAIFHYTVEPV